jgi:hypothetical protein
MIVSPIAVVAVSNNAAVLVASIILFIVKNYFVHRPTKSIGYYRGGRKRTSKKPKTVPSTIPELIIFA